MQLTRRGLIGLLAGAALDPERLLWKPGKLISIPKPILAVHVYPGAFPGRASMTRLYVRDGDAWRLISGIGNLDQSQRPAVQQPHPSRDLR